MKWSKSSQDLTRKQWHSLKEIERFEATRFWMEQNRKQGKMDKRAAYTSMRRALKRSNVIIPPITTMSKLELLSFKYRSDHLLERFCPNRRKLWQVAGKRRPLKDKNHITVIQVEEFSLLDNPVAVFRILSDLCYIEAVSPPGAINFSDDRIRDIGSYLLFSIIYQRMVQFAEGGLMSRKVAKVLKAVGLTRAMRISVSDQDTKDVFPLPLSTHSQENMLSTSIGGQTSRKEKVASEVINKIKEWLKNVGVPITSIASLVPLGEGHW